MTTVNGRCFNCNKAYLNCYQTCPNSPIEKTSAKPILVETQKPQTNFDKITESVESLAEWFVELSKTKSIDGDITSYYNLGSKWHNKWT